jgi:hypothetical protein
MLEGEQITALTADGQTLGSVAGGRPGTLSLSGDGPFEIPAVDLYEGQEFSIVCTGVGSLVLLAASRKSVTLAANAALVITGQVGSLDVQGAVTLAASAAMTVTDSSFSFAAGVSISGTATFTGGSLSFATAGLIVQSEAAATFTDTSLSFAAGVGTGLTVQTGATATATGTTFQSADDATVAVLVEEGGQFTVESSRLAGADGAGCERAALPLRAASPTYAGTPA